MWYMVFLAAIIIVPALWRLTYRRWLQKVTEKANLYRESTDTPLGNVDYSWLGDGPVVLQFHAAGAGHDMGTQMGPLISRGYSVLTPDRPGYWGTSLDTSGSFETQAEIAATLLDELGIEQVAVIGVSAGGPAAIQFVLKYPERAHALILMSAYTGRYVSPGPKDYECLERNARYPYALDRNMYYGAKWLQLRPKSYLRRLARGSTTYDSQETERVISSVLANKAQMRQLKESLELSCPMRMRHPGMVNDFMQLRDLESLPLENLRIATLLIASRRDKVVAYETTVDAHTRIPGSELMTVDQFGHMLCLGDPAVADAIDSRVEGFLALHFRAGDSFQE